MICIVPPALNPNERKAEKKSANYELRTGPNASKLTLSPRRRPNLKSGPAQAPDALPETLAPLTGCMCRIKRHGEVAVAGEKHIGEVPLYGEGEDEAASMAKAANRTEGPGTAEKPGRRIAGKTETGEPVPEQAPREQHGLADRRPSRA